MQGKNHFERLVLKSLFALMREASYAYNENDAPRELQEIEKELAVAIRIREEN